MRRAIPSTLSAAGGRLVGKLPTSLVSTMGANVLIQIGSLIGSILVARELGETARGELAGALAWSMLLSAVADFGVSQAVPYQCARRPMEPGTTVGTGFAFAFVSGLAFALVGMVTVVPLLAGSGAGNGPGSGAGLGRAAAIALLSIPVTLVATYAAVAAQGLGLLGTFNRLRILQSLAYAGGLIGAVLAGAGSAATVLAVILACQTAVMGLSLLSIHRHASASSWRVEREAFGHLFRYGFKTHLGNLAWIANGRLDHMIMSVALPTATLGIYANAGAYASALFSLLSAVSMVVFPDLAATADRGALFAKLRGALGRSLKLGLILGLPLALLAPWLLPFAFGAAFAAGVVPAMILVARSGLMGLNYVLSIGLRAADRPLLPSIAEGVGLIATAVGLPLLLGRFGIVGAAWVGFGASLATFGLLLLLVRRTARESRPVEVSL